MESLPLGRHLEAKSVNSCTTRITWVDLDVDVLLVGHIFTQKREAASSLTTYRFSGGKAAIPPVRRTRSRRKRETLDRTKVVA